MGSRSSTQQSVPAWALPYAQEFLRTGTSLIAPGATDAQGNVLSANPFPLTAMPAGLLQQVAPFSAAQQAGLSALEGGALPSAQLAGANAQQIGQTLGGAYLNSNPYLDATYNDAASALTNQYKMATAPSLMAQAQQGGVAGGSAAQEQQAYNQFGLGQNLSGLAAQIYGTNYQDERARQLQASGLVPGAQGAIAAPGQQLLGAGTLEQSQAQTLLDTQRANAQLQQEYPFQLLSYLGNALGTATGGGGQVTAGTSK